MYWSKCFVKKFLSVLLKYNSYYKNHPFKLYNSVVFSIFIVVQWSLLLNFRTWSIEFFFFKIKQLLTITFEDFGLVIYIKFHLYLCINSQIPNTCTIKSLLLIVFWRNRKVYVREGLSKSRVLKYNLQPDWSIGFWI